MSRIAKKLCDEIVECPLKNITYREYPKNLSGKCGSQISKENPSRLKKPTRSIVVDKNRQINNYSPNDLSKSRIEVTSEEKLHIKSYTNRAVNTLITGILRCDNNCVTVIQKRDNKCSCKCGNKHLSSKSSTKQVQTFDSKVYFSDKACAQCIETLTCGTQFIEKQGSVTNSQNQIIRGIVRPAQYKRHPDLRQIFLRQTDVQRPAVLRDSAFKNSDMRHPYLGDANMKNSDGRNSILKQKDLRAAHIHDQKGSYNYMGARRWALSQHHTSQGPDF